MNRSFLILLCCIAPSIANAIDGYVYGDNHCFYFASPKDWVADNISGKQSGLPFVFYPSDSSWANAKTVIYARVMDKSETIKKPLDVVNDTLKLFHAEYKSPNSKAEIIESIVSKSGSDAVIYKFTGDSFGNTELASYFVGKDTINYFVMTSRDPIDLNNNKHILIELSKTYREANDCVPCGEKQHNKSLNLTHSANALCAG